jgi:outer membrane receptor protein involved in Fe transport
MKSLTTMLAAIFCCLQINTQAQTQSDSALYMEQVIVTANRTAQKRTEAPVAISTITNRQIQETKAQTLDILLNKVSGVYMANLGNEQHSMSIRQPITTKSLFLYLEDGLPIRTTGVYNHNALLELNLPSAERIEVIKGPSSSLYGAEAIGGVVNLITQMPPEKQGGFINYQFNNNGYKRAEAQYGIKIGKLGLLINGYYADRKNGQLEYSNFSKKALNFKGVYSFSKKIQWINSLAWVDYYSNMTGGLDSIKFAKKDFSTFHTFTYRSVYSLRYRSGFEIKHNDQSMTNINFVYRDNSIGQNPSYLVGSTSNPLLYRGQINDNAFSSKALFIQHEEKLKWLNSKIIVGGTLDNSPQSYYAKFIWINRASPTGKFINYTSPNKDSLLNSYKTKIQNTAVYANYEFTPLKNVRTVVSLRYDNYKYGFNNDLPPTATSGGPSSTQSFSRVTPKIGLTYNYRKIGFYANYSEGYVPPQLNELFNSVKTPYLKPQTFVNYEIGGWITLLKNKIYADWSLYQLDGSNEIVSVRQTDGTNVNQNSGKTTHKGLEYGLNLKPNDQIAFRLSGTFAKHQFVEYVVRGISFNNMEMSGAPRTIFNTELNYKPKFIIGLRLGVEWQHQGKYFMDDRNLFTYGGFDLIHARVGYTYKFIDCWINAINLTDAYYSTSATKSTASGNASYSYNIGTPREITLGIGFKF